MTQHVLITGASRGIGARTAVRFASPARHLIVVARNEDALQTTCEQVAARGGSATCIPADLASTQAVRELLDEVERRFGTPEGLILNAGTSNDKRLSESSRADLEYELAVNYLAPAEMLMRLLPRMTRSGGGRVVIVGSLASLVPFPGNASYAASKAALLTLIRSLRLETESVDFGVVLPGMTDTAMTESKQSLLPRMSADEVADAIFDCYSERRRLVVPGTANDLAARIFGAFPDTADQLLSRVAPFLVPSK